MSTRLVNVCLEKYMKLSFAAKRVLTSISTKKWKNLDWSFQEMRISVFRCTQRLQLVFLGEPGAVRRDEENSCWCRFYTWCLRPVPINCPRVSEVRLYAKFNPISTKVIHPFKYINAAVEEKHSHQTTPSPRFPLIRLCRFQGNCASSAGEMRFHFLRTSQFFFMGSSLVHSWTLSSRFTTP